MHKQSLWLCRSVCLSLSLSLTFSLSLSWRRVLSVLTFTARDWDPFAVQQVDRIRQMLGLQAGESSEVLREAHARLGMD